ncbi:hypothetical protein ACIBQ1_40110 [Nonomuraea sp. NPDC050153]|uniref:hypothetical protein n=1 Tax=Nonomuraea sp. NPDC050153 TaxID=3364359 RepID=UPI0037BAE73A
MLSAWPAAGCSDGQSVAPGGSPPPPPAATSPAAQPQGSAAPAQADFSLVVQNDCLANRPSWAEVACDDDQAVARVVGLGLVSNPVGAGSALASCPADTDEVLNRPDGGGYYCLRSLRPPHRSRPGLGGGIVVVGDCLIKHSANYVEIPCAGGGQRPEYKVVDINERKEGPCPKDKGRVRLSPDRLGLKTYCAKRL